MKISLAEAIRNPKIANNSSELIKKKSNNFQTVGQTIPTPSSNYGKIEPLFIDAIGRKVPTYIEDDNVLIFGSNPEWNLEVATSLVDAFHRAGYSAVIVHHDKFLSLSPAQKRFGESKNVIICNDVYLAPAQFV